MKKIVLVLVFVLPVLAFGQVVQNIEVSKEMKMVNVARPIVLNISQEKGINQSGFPHILGPIYETTVNKTEYEAIVFDVGFELFLTSQHPKQFYSQSTLKSKNTLMVAEWNLRHNQPIRYNPAIYEVNIDYDPLIDYGLDVEYTLYMFFRFMGKEHNIKLS